MGGIPSSPAGFCGQSGCVCFGPHCTFCSCQVIYLKATGLIALDLAGHGSNESLAPIEMQPMKPKIATENNLPMISGQNLRNSNWILSRLPPFLLQPVPRQHSRDPIDPSNPGVLASWWRKSRCHRPGCGCHDPLRPPAATATVLPLSHASLY